MFVSKLRKGGVPLASSLSPAPAQPPERTAMSRVLFFPPTINGETEWISPKEDIMFQSLSELLGD